MDEGTQDGSTDPAAQQGMAARADALLEDVGKRVSHFVLVASARLREEAEDIYAEAQGIRRGERE